MSQVPVVYLDTNVALWLVGAPERVSITARALIDGAEEVRISPMVELELEYLHEIGRLNVPADDVLDRLRADADVRTCDLALPLIVSAARGLHWTRDPFDRLIVAQAAVARAVLVTGDRQIRANVEHARW